MLINVFNKYNCSCCFAGPLWSPAPCLVHTQVVSDLNSPVGDGTDLASVSQKAKPQNCRIMAVGFHRVVMHEIDR